MPLDKYEWSENIGWVQDKFGISWQIFTGENAGYGTEIFTNAFIYKMSKKAEQKRVLILHFSI